MELSTLRLGTASPASKETSQLTLDSLGRILKKASSLQIDILLLPEAYLGGYPRGSAFGCKIGDRSVEGRAEFLNYWKQAVDLGDEVGDGAGGGDRWTKRELGHKDAKRGDGSREALESLAARTGVFIVVGCIEKAGGSLYCSVVYVCPKAGMVGKRRKVMPVSPAVSSSGPAQVLTRQTATERLIWAQGSPATLRAVSTTIRGTRVNMAAAICWESYMPLLRQSLYAQNINLYLAPTADGRETWLSLMRTIGIEGRCFVVSSNMAQRKSPASAASQEKQDESPAVEWVSRGGSSIVSPFGDVLAGPQWEDDEEIIYADVDFDDCIRGRLDLDVAGSYSR